MNTSIITHHYKIRQYLSDNPELMQHLLAAVRKPGGQTLVVSGCGTGKTFSFLREVASRAPDRNIVLAVPNVVQAIQNEGYGTPERPVVVAAGGDYEIPDDGFLASVTYDKAAALNRLAGEALSRTCLIIDEAHQIVSERSYRRKAIRDMLSAARSVCAAGGSVIYLTATPRRLLHPEFFEAVGPVSQAEAVICNLMDGQGNLLPKVKVGRLRVLRKAEKTDLYSTLAHYLEERYFNGSRTVILLNDKDKINRLIAGLSGKGVRIHRLTSDDKAFTEECYIDSNGLPVEPHKVYVNEAYGSVVTSELLPDADVYLCTSMLEAGTSIKGIRMADGSVIQPSDLASVYVAARADRLDLDKVHQFISRVRFGTDEAVLILGHAGDGCPEEAAAQTFDALKARADRELAYRETAGPMIHGLGVVATHTKSLLSSGRIDILEAIEQACRDYDRQAYSCGEFLVEALREALGIPVGLEYLRKRPKRKSEAVELDEATYGDLAAVIRDQECWNALASQYVYDSSHPLIQSLIRRRDGLRVLTSAMQYAKLATLDRQTLPELIREEFAGRKVYVDAATGSVVQNRKDAERPVEAVEYAEMRAYGVLAGHADPYCRKILRCYEPETGAACEGIAEILEGRAADMPEIHMIRYLMGTEKFAALYGIGQHDHFSCNAQKVFEIGSRMGLGGIREIAQELIFIELNQCPSNSKQIKAIKAKHKNITDEYLILRYPGRYLLGRDGRPLFPEIPAGSDFSGKTLSRDKLQMIAEHMPDSIRRLRKLGEKATIAAGYDAGKIRQRLMMIYSINASRTNEERLVINCPRKVLHQLRDG